MNPLRVLWQLHPPVSLMVGASRGQCLQTLMTATRPSTDRLHHRDLFREGRRYHLQPLPQGFQLTSTTRVFWGGRRQRTSAASVLTGTFAAPEGDSAPVTLLRLSARMKPYAIVTALLLPVFMASIVAYMPWNIGVTLTLIASLFALSWFGHRFNAAYQANEMVYFVRTVMDDLPRAELPELAARGPDIVVDAPAGGDQTSAAFMAEWERFVEHQAARDDGRG